jgi:DNA repair protein RecN (Recombination protein N)
MIESLRIENFILAQSIEIFFSRGLQVLSGETGAGKSVLIGALNYLLGEKVQAELPYDSDKPAYLEAVFRIDKDRESLLTKMNEMLFLDETKELIISREIKNDGTSRSFINGRRTSLAVIREIRDLILDFHSQRDQIKLFNANYQLEIIDIYGNLRQKRKEYSSLYYESKQMIKKLNALKEAELSAAERNRLYAYQIEELEQLDLKADEEKELQEELDILTNSEDILSTCGEMQQVIFENDNSTFDLISNYLQKMSRFGDSNPHVQKIKEVLRNVLDQFNELRGEARNLAEAVDIDKEKLGEVEKRLEEIIRIKNKYKLELPQIIDYLAEMRKVIRQMSSQNEEIEKLQNTLSNKTDCLRKLAKNLSLDRKRASKSLSEDIVSNIARLAILDSSLQILFENYVDSADSEYGLEWTSDSGIDRVNFLFSANKGVKVQPLKSSISGGELSRLQLVIKRILAGRMDTISMVFDEIDSGIGGKTAARLGEFLAEVSDFHQVVCITHLPQIASMAEKHFLIEKKSASGKSRISVKELTAEERKEEIARMLSGTNTELAIKHAEELLSKE